MAPPSSSSSLSLAAMIRALKALQDKIRTLELERVAAADKFRHLSQETQRHSQATQARTASRSASSRASPPGYPSSLSPDQEGVCVCVCVCVCIRVCVCVCLCMCMCMCMCMCVCCGF